MTKPNGKSNVQNGAFTVIASAKRTKAGEDKDNENVGASVYSASSSSGVEQPPEKRLKGKAPDENVSEQHLAPLFRRKTVASSSLASASSTQSAFTWKIALGHEMSCLRGEYGKPFERDIQARKASSKTGSVKVACFDLDGCLIKAKDGKTWPSQSDPYDFEQAFRGTFARVRRAYEDEGACIAIISNQAQKDVRSKKLETWKAKMAHIARAIDCPFIVFAALSKDGFRKPGRLMWDEGVVQCYIDAGGSRQDIVDERGSPLEDAGTFFVGDAAGRVGDHADTDRKWAMNIGMPFYTPEEYFLGQQPKKHTLTGWQPTLPAAQDEAGTLPANFFNELSNGTLEIVLFVGSPGAGKTTFYHDHFAHRDYAWVNQDTLRTASRCLTAVRTNLQQGRSVVVDNTNRNVETRAPYIHLASTMENVKIRCVFFDVPKELSRHNNFFRVRAGIPARNNDVRQLLPEIAFSSYYANLQQPTRQEGFDADIAVVRWSFNGDEEAKRRWLMRWD